MKTKPQALDALELYNKAIVIPNNTRLIPRRADKGTEFTSSEFRQCCHDIGVSLEFASLNTPQQMGSMRGQEGVLLELCVACLLIRVSTLSRGRVDEYRCLRERQGPTRSIG